MTNDELASFLEDVTWGEQKVDDSFVYEAAKRLRRPTPVDDLKMAQDIDEKNRKISILEERVKIAIRAFEKIDSITKEEETAIVAGGACVSMTADDHAYKYLFEEVPPSKDEK